MYRRAALLLGDRGQAASNVAPVAVDVVVAVTVHDAATDRYPTVLCVPRHRRIGEAKDRAWTLHCNASAIVGRDGMEQHKTGRRLARNRSVYEPAVVAGGDAVGHRGIDCVCPGAAPPIHKDTGGSIVVHLDAIEHGRDRASRDEVNTVSAI